MASLPPYETLVRWTVADTTRWLGENGLNEFKDSFKKNGVDGSKLAKLTDTDIDAFNVKSAKKRIQLKNAVSNIDRSKVNSLPKTQGMMNAFRRNDFSEPAPPPRPPRKALPPEPEPEPPFSHAPPPPANHPLPHHQQHHHEDDEDNEDAYSWGDDFYQSDPEDEDGLENYENQQEWTQDHNSNYIDMNRTHGNDEEFYEQPTNSPSQSFNGGGILQKLQRELTLRKTAHTKTHRTRRNNDESDYDDDDEDSENYELPIGAPPQDPVPSVPPRPGGGKPKRPPDRVEEKAPERPPPRPPKPSPHPAKLPPTTRDEDELVYDEPEEEKLSRPRDPRPRAGSRQLPPVPSLLSPAKEERNLPPPPKSKSANRQPKPPPPVQPPPPQEQEVYEEVDQGPVQTSNRDTRPPAKKPQPVKRTSSRPLPGIPPTNGVKETNNSIKKVVKVPRSPRDELDIYDWYHKNIDRQTAEETLKQYSEDGMYLIRKSRRGGTEQQYTLTIYKQVRVYNLPIRKKEKEGKFALGAAKPNELEFDSVPHLVDYFKTKLIMLNPNAKSAAGSTKLIKPMPK